MVNGRFQCIGSQTHLKTKFGHGCTLMVSQGHILYMCFTRTYYYHITNTMTNTMTNIITNIIFLLSISSITYLFMNSSLCLCINKTSNYLSVLVIQLLIYANYKYRYIGNTHSSALLQQHHFYFRCTCPRTLI